VSCLGKNGRKAIGLLMITVLIIGTALGADEQLPLRLLHSDTYEYIRGQDYDTIFITGSVAFSRGIGSLVADTAIWVKGKNIILAGNVFVEDTVYQISADRIDYDLNYNTARAFGDTVIIISEVDSLMAVGTNAYYCRDSAVFRMHDRPTIYFNYQDSSRMGTIRAERVALNSEDKIGYADGDVMITQFETQSHSGRAIMYLEEDVLFLTDMPIARRHESEISGDTLIFLTDRESLRRIHVFGGGEGSFKEPSKEDSSLFDISELRATELEFALENGKLDSIKASGQAFSLYRPAAEEGAEVVKNEVSGDTIKLRMEDESLNRVDVIGGAEGYYMTGKYSIRDSVQLYVEDTVDYSADKIDYTLVDSTITLQGSSYVSDGAITLKARRIKYNTARELVTAFDDTLETDSGAVYYPVVLEDKAEEIFGSYLEYSLRTDRGLIRQSKSSMDIEHYTGGELYRREKEVYYVEDGTYCSCEYEDADYHFWAKHMKLIQGDKIIARPVVFFIEKIPLLIVPYYVFPIKPDRHSGFLSFKFGNFSRGGRYIHNVGYYWAASEYWDLLGALDYTENFGFNYRGEFKYNVRYKMSGSLSGSYANESRYLNSISYLNSKRWRITGRHSHTVSPTLSINAYGEFLSDKSYYTDFSTDLEDRLKNNIRSQVSLSKRWDRATLSAQFLHDVALADESRTDQLPRASLSFSPFLPFGSPAKDEQGREVRKWYHNFSLRYGVNLNNFSSRQTIEEVDTTGSTPDTTTYRSRREYITVDHSASFSGSFNLLKYLKFNPSLNCQETWYKIFETDQSRQAGIEASTFYRRFAYSASLSASTELYGVVNPNLLGLEGLRHVMTPRIGYTWRPEINRHDNIKSYAGVGGGGSRSQALSFSLGHLFQAKVRSGEESRRLDLFSVNSSLSYDFEAPERKFSLLTTGIQTSLLRSLTLSASMVHDLYEEGTDELRWWSPYLKSFTLSSQLSFSKTMGEYEGNLLDTLSSPLEWKSGYGTEQKWRFSVRHSYTESGKGVTFGKVHQVSFSVSGNLTPTINFTYAQSYDFVSHKTINRRLQLVKKFKCWEGHFSWVPDGSNAGYYFRINVISIPDIKFEKKQTGIRDAFPL